jgi:hypothetical protein
MHHNSSPSFQHRNAATFEIDDVRRRSLTEIKDSSAPRPLALRNPSHDEFRGFRCRTPDDSQGGVPEMVDRSSYLKTKATLLPAALIAFVASVIGAVAFPGSAGALDR